MNCHLTFDVHDMPPGYVRTDRRGQDVHDDLAMLDAPLEQWRVFLHPSQRKLVEMNANGPVRVLGGAGTGKTVVLMVPISVLRVSCSR